MRKNAHVEPMAIGTSSLRIGCFNVAHGRGTGDNNWKGGDRDIRMNRLRAMARFIKESALDICVLNEVDFCSTWSKHVNQAQVLAAEAGFAQWVEQRNLDFRLIYGSWKFGNAILSRYPILEASVVDFPAYATWETIAAGKKRGVVCTIRTGKESHIRVLAVHLSPRSEALRVQCVQTIDKLRRKSPLPLVLAGDFNSTLPEFPATTRDANGKTAMAELHCLDAFQLIPSANPTADMFTFSATQPRSVIDWILVPKGWNVENYRVHQIQLSDHFPITCTITPPTP